MLFCKAACPACSVVGRLRRHAWYYKFYYNDPLKILRCICTRCGTTHAIIPSFSVPGTSIGTAEAEEYIALREGGYGRRRAADRVFTRSKAMSEKYPLVLDRSFETVVERARAIFSGMGDERLRGSSWIESLTGQREHPIVGLNQFCLEHGVNAVCLTRFSIHLFGKKRKGGENPHNYGSRRIWKVVVDSW